MAQSVNYQQIHAYMLRKTQEYYQCPPKILVEQVIAEQRKKGIQVTPEEARKLVSSIDIQRLIKKEMEALWPEFMASIPSNPLRDQNT